MHRRAFLGTLASGLLAAPLAVEAQQAGRVSRIGLLSSASPSAGADRLRAFKEGLHALGYVEGRNLIIEYRWAEGRDERLPALAADLVRLKVEMIVTQGTSASLEARRVSATMPVVFAVAGDPVAAGLVASLTHPGGNVTGLAVMGSEMTAKRLELLREALPQVTRVAALWNPGNASSRPELQETEAAARTLRLQLQSKSEMHACLTWPLPPWRSNERRPSSSCRTACYLGSVRGLLTWPSSNGCPQSHGRQSLPRVAAC